MDVDAYRQMMADVRGMDIVGYLSRMGHEPVKVSNADYWYLSPLRAEHTPSFKVNRRMNRWFDHGTGQGGNIIDFGIRYHSCTVGEFLKLVGTDLSLHRPDREHVVYGNERGITVMGDTPLTSPRLLEYLAQRRIPLAVAMRFCRQVAYRQNGRNYYGIGFRNDSGGFELRNPYFKAGSSPKDVTTFTSGSPEVKVFEGFMDFLSFKVIEGKDMQPTDMIVLNSLAFFEKARGFMDQHEVVKLYLDRDTAGQNCSRAAMASDHRYRDESSLYEGFKDVNEWLAGKGQSSRRNRRMKL